MLPEIPRKASKDLGTLRKMSRNNKSKNNAILNARKKTFLKMKMGRLRRLDLKNKQKN